MPKELFRDEVRRLIDASAQVVDVLELESYREAHLPGAIHIHLRNLKQEAPKKLDRSRPVIAYCNDFA